MGLGTLRRYHKSASAEVPAVGRPAKDASKADWSAYAGSLGISIEGLTKDQIRDAVSAQEAGSPAQEPQEPAGEPEGSSEGSSATGQD